MSDDIEQDHDEALRAHEDLARGIIAPGMAVYLGTFNIDWLAKQRAVDAERDTRRAFPNGHPRDALIAENERLRALLLGDMAAILQFRLDAKRTGSGVR